MYVYCMYVCMYVCMCADRIDKGIYFTLFLFVYYQFFSRSKEQAAVAARVFCVKGWCCCVHRTMGC